MTERTILATDEEIKALLSLLVLANRAGNGDLQVAEAAVFWKQKLQKVLE